jgi:DNA-binding transcriptional ArsR family regulator
MRPRSADFYILHAEVCKALANPKRLEVVHRLGAEGRLCAAELIQAIGLSKATLSQQLPFLFQHATQGWCPPLPLFRKRGVRTRKEIEREKYALKALRRDFDPVTSEDAPGTRSNRALEAVTA